VKTMSSASRRVAASGLARVLLAAGAGAVVAWAVIPSPARWAASAQSDSQPGVIATHQARPANTPPPGVSSSVASARRTAATAWDKATVPALRHIYWILLEDHNLVEVAASGDAPYLASLITRSALAVNYHAVASISLPNYIALLGGSTYGITDSAVHYFDAANLMDQIEDHGRTWAVYAQNVPTGCFLGETAANGPDGPGTYVRRHEPAVSFTSIVGDPARCARITNLSHFQPGLSDFSLIVPNLCNGMHECGVGVGDRFLRRLIQSIRTSPSWSADDAIFLTFDEGGSSTRAGLLVFSGAARAGTRSTTWHNHYSLLRTVQDAWRLGCLEMSCTASPLGELFRSGAR